MRFVKFFLKCSLCIGSFLLLQQLIECKTRGFGLNRVQANDLPFYPGWEVEPLDEVTSQSIDAKLLQNYHFLGAGSECFAFISDDGTTVIKFFKLDLLRPVYLYRGLFREDYSEYAGTFSTHPLINNYTKRLFGMREYRLKRTFDSLKLSYEELKEETGLLYLHLNPTQHIKKHLRFYDSCGIAHLIDLDTAKFFLQRKAVLVEERLLELKKGNNEKKAKECIDSLITLILKRCKKGFADRDILNRNLGFLGTKAIEIDLGSFTRASKMKQPWLYQQEVYYATLELKEWLKKHYPELSCYLEERVHQEIQL